jgi:hypothetical protein
MLAALAAVLVVARKLLGGGGRAGSAHVKLGHVAPGATARPSQ